MNVVEIEPPELVAVTVNVVMGKTDDVVDPGAEIKPVAEAIVRNPGKDGDMVKVRSMAFTEAVSGENGVP